MRRKPLVDGIEAAIIRGQIDYLLDGFSYLATSSIQENRVKTKEIELLYNLVGRVNGGHDLLRARFHEWVSSHGLEMVNFI